MFLQDVELNLEHWKQHPREAAQLWRKLAQQKQIAKSLQILRFLHHHRVEAFFYLFLFWKMCEVNDRPRHRHHLTFWGCRCHHFQYRHGQSLMALSLGVLGAYAAKPRSSNDHHLQHRTLSQVNRTENIQQWTTDAVVIVVIVLRWWIFKLPNGRAYWIWRSLWR